MFLFLKQYPEKYRNFPKFRMIEKKFVRKRLKKVKKKMDVHKHLNPLKQSFF